jgi:hypothetical protein
MANLYEVRVQTRSLGFVVDSHHQRLTCITGAKLNELKLPMYTPSFGAMSPPSNTSRTKASDLVLVLASILILLKTRTTRFLYVVST